MKAVKRFAAAASPGLGWTAPGKRGRPPEPERVTRTILTHRNRDHLLDQPFLAGGAVLDDREGHADRGDADRDGFLGSLAVVLAEAVAERIVLAAGRHRALERRGREL